MAVATAMALWLAAAATLSLFPAAGLAQEAAAPGTVATIVETCVAQTPRGELAPECIGAAARQCQQSPDGETTLGITDCLMAEHAVWDAALNREYKTVRAMLADDDTASAGLLAAQRAWIAWRDAECAFQYDRHGGGSIRTVAAATCRMNLTAMRALDLKALHE